MEPRTSFLVLYGGSTSVLDTLALPAKLRRELSVDMVGGWYTGSPRVLMLKTALLFSLQEVGEVGMLSMQPMPCPLSSSLQSHHPNAFV